MARSIKEYEDGLYHQWVETVNATLPQLTKKPLLIKPEMLGAGSSNRATPISRDLSRIGSRLDQSLILPSSKVSKELLPIVVCD